MYRKDVLVLMYLGKMCRPDVSERCAGQWFRGTEECAEERREGWLVLVEEEGISAGGLRC